MPVENDVAAALDGQGIPPSLTTSVLAAMAAAGLNLTPSGGGDPVAALESLVGAKYAVEGMPGTFLSVISLGGGGGATRYLVYMEWSAKDGTITRSHPVLVAGAGGASLTDLES